MRFTRRNFMKVLGAGALTVAAPGCTSHETQRMRSAEWVERHEELKCSICRLCPGGCGLKVRVVNGRAVQVLGNPLHPVNRGGLCPRALASVERLYDPDRLTEPMQRVGPPGSGEWAAISWEEALSQVSERLVRLREEDRPEGLVVLDGQEAGLGEQILARFARYYGTPNYVRFRSIEPHRISTAHALMQGGDAPLGYDLSRASFILCFGTGLLESWISPVSQMRSIAELRASDKGTRARLVVIGPRMSVTAARADQWIPIRPGTEGALALGIAYVILREAMHDRAFLNDHAFGFEDWTDASGQTHMGFKSLLYSRYNPQAVSEITGVRPETILSLAREFALSKPAVAIGEPEDSWGSTDFYDRMAIHALNALTGNVADEGTFTRQGAPPTTPFVETRLDETATASLKRPRVDGAGDGVHFLTGSAVQELPGRILAKRPYPVDLLLLFDSNPVFSQPGKEEFARALAAVPFVVSFSSFLDETAEHSNLVLPMTTFSERWELVEDRHHAGFSLVSVGEPAVAGIGKARDGAEVMLNLADRLGGTVRNALPWQKTSEVVDHKIRGLFEANRGYVVTEPLEGAFRRILERQGLRDPEFKSFEEFREALIQRGAWWDPTDSSRERIALIQTESHKFEFYSTRLRDRFEEAVRRRAGSDRSLLPREQQRLRAELGIEADGDLLFLPHYEPQKRRADELRYPLVLHVYRLLSLGSGELANIPWIQEGLAVDLEVQWDSWVEVNPETTRDLGLREGDLVTIESPKGTVRTRIRLNEGTMPGVVAMPLGQGHVALGRHARHRGANPMDLIENLPDARAGMGVLGTTPVRIVKA